MWICDHFSTGCLLCLPPDNHQPPLFASGSIRTPRDPKLYINPYQASTTLRTVAHDPLARLPTPTNTTPAALKSPSNTRGVGALIPNSAQLPSRAILEDDRTIFRLSGRAHFLDVPQGKCNFSLRVSSENKLEITVIVSILRCLRDELYFPRGCVHEMASMSPLMIMVIVGHPPMAVWTLHSYTPVDDKDPTDSTLEA